MLFDEAAGPPRAADRHGRPVEPGPLDTTFTPPRVPLSTAEFKGYAEAGADRLASYPEFGTGPGEVLYACEQGAPARAGGAGD
jgi:hypothetical protein